MLSCMTLLIFDVDGTLIDETTKSHAPALPELLGTLKAQGNKIALITGRFVLPQSLLDLVQPDAWALGNGNRIFMAADGAGGEDVNEGCVKGDCVEQHVLTSVEVQTALDVLGDLPLIVVGSALKDHPVNFVSEFEHPRWDAGRSGGHILPLTEMMHHEVLHVMFMGAHAPEMRKRLLHALPHLNITGGMPPYLDCVNVYPGQASKHLALQKIAARLGIPLAEVIAFGDSDNDLEMLRVAGHAVQVGEMPYLKDLCHDQVSCPLIGLPVWLEQHVLRKAHVQNIGVSEKA